MSDSNDLSPFEDKIFVRIMEAILEQSDHKRTVIASGMGLVDKEVNPVPYYTMDCALCYLTYKEIAQKTKNLENTKIMRRLENRAKKNMILMEKAHQQNTS